MPILNDTKKKGLDEVGKLLVDAIKQSIDDKGVNASGNLKDSVEYVVTDTGLQVLANYYFPYAEVGRKEGNIPKDFGSILADWVKNKGISVPSQFKDELQFGWAIANKIKMYGSKRYRDSNPVDLLEDAIEKAEPMIDEILSGYFLQTINDDLNI